MKTVLAALNLLVMFSLLSPSEARYARSETTTCVNDTWNHLSLPASIEVGFGLSWVSLWTGSEVIFWRPGLQGFRYNPSTAVWSPITRIGQPNTINVVAAFWIGNEMIVMGNGNTDGSFSTRGGRYDPKTDTWRPIATANSPTYPWTYTSVWTGSEILLWSGAQMNPATGQPIGGARYDPATDTWTTISIANAPGITRGKFSFPNPVAVWTGKEMLILGVFYLGELGPMYRYVTGRYDPSTDTWRALSTLGTPEPREGINVVWTGTELIAWQGLFLAARYDPVGDSWRSMDTFTMPRTLQDGAEVVLWTGAEMLAWGNRSDSRGGKYDPATDTWKPMSALGDPGGGVFAGAWARQQLIVAGTVEPIGGGNPFPAAASYCDLAGFVPPCSYSLSTTESRFTSVGGSGTVSLSTQSQCKWTASTNAPWVTITSATSGDGNAVIGYSVSPVTDASSTVRRATIAVGDTNLSIVQNGPPAISNVTASGKNLVVAGSNFDGGAVILVDGNVQKTLRDDQNPNALTGKKSAKGIPSGTTVSVQVQNGDGALSRASAFTRP